MFLITKNDNKNEEGAMFIPSRHQNETTSRFIPNPPPALLLLVSPSPCPIGERGWGGGTSPCSLVPLSPATVHWVLVHERAKSVVAVTNKKTQKHQRKLADITKQSINQFTWILPSCRLVFSASCSLSSTSG